MKVLAGILFFCVLSFATKAQRTCGTVSYPQPLHSTMARPSGNQLNDTVLNQTINIPVVVHVLYNTPDENISDSQVLSQLLVLNHDYNRQNADTLFTPACFKAFAGNARINFCLARIDANGKNTNGILRVYTNQQLFTTNDAVKYTAQGGDDIWDCKRYLNIWVCNLDSTSLGYGTFPGGPADRDGVVVGYKVFGTIGNLRMPFNKGRTATHEIGHWLGLMHTWGDTDCGTDSIADTPQQEAYNFGCPSFPHLSNCSPNANGDMYMDFMDFTDDACMNMFTIDQVKEMKSLFMPGNSRSSFLNAYQCDSLLIQGGPLPVTISATDTITVQSIVTVYPNPAYQQLIIEMNTASPVQKKACIFNMLGMQVLQVLINQPKTIVNLSGLNAGIYLLEVGEGKNIFSTKIIHE